MKISGEIEIKTNPMLEEVIKQAGERGIFKICSEVCSMAKEMAPVRKTKGGGRLRGSIVFDTTAGGSGKVDGVLLKNRLDGYVGTSVEYAVYQEYGTKRMSPQPFLRPAIAVKAQGQSGMEVMKKTMDEHARGKLTPSNMQTREKFVF